MRSRLFKAFQEEGLPYGNLLETYNTRLAQELALWADEQPGGAALHDALLVAVFVDGRNIGDPAVLLDLVDACGLDRAGASEVLEQRSRASQLLAEWTFAKTTGLTGVPAFIAGGMAVVGAQPLATLEHLLERAGASRLPKT
ncbi:MAG: putative DsbA family dithiol-disulfide isomerase [Myxococcota bacterium]|jgi:predicted DsbA family dithiol-disulfide isomerase